MKLTLLVLAAGMGSRYGSLKQMDPIGPSGEAILDYSVYDAIRAGFGRVVFVIRESFADDFKSVFNTERFGGRIEVAYVYQELTMLPDGYSVPDGRVKPWGTNHAIMMGAGVIDGPFAAINADDFYGRDAIARIGEFLQSVMGLSGRYAMVGYEVANTLSPFGSVSRGVCQLDEQGMLSSICERTKILRRDAVCGQGHNDGQVDRQSASQANVVYIEQVDGAPVEVPLNPHSAVSMNLFGFTPDYFDHSTSFFKDFLDANNDNLTAEYYIAHMVTHLIENSVATMRVLPTTSQWFGVTYKEDRADTQAKIGALIAGGEYPRSLWGS